MNLAFLKAMLALLPGSLLLLGSAIIFLRTKTLPAFMQLLGAIAIMLVVIAHICEALSLFPAMHWGLERSSGHYVDLGFATLGFFLFPVGYYLHAVSSK